MKIIIVITVKKILALVIETPNHPLAKIIKLGHLLENLIMKNISNTVVVKPRKKTWVHFLIDVYLYWFNKLLLGGNLPRASYTTYLSALRLQSSDNSFIQVTFFSECLGNQKSWKLRNVSLDKKQSWRIP